MYIKLKQLIKESFVHSNVIDDYDDIVENVNDEFHSGQKHQTWKLIPKKNLIKAWISYAKYGRIDDDEILYIWELIKTNVIKIVYNSDIHNDIASENFFYVDDYKDITDKMWKRFYNFISDLSGNSPIRNVAEIGIGGTARYTDSHKRLYELLEKCYSAETAEQLLIGIDQILNYMHGIGYMAKWFVEGGVSTLNIIRDYDVKGIVLKEAEIEKIDYPLINKNGYFVQGNYNWKLFNIGKHYSDGDVLRYIHSQHADFIDDDRVNGVYLFTEINPRSIPESTWYIDDKKVVCLSQSKNEYPPIVVNKYNEIVDGGHRLAAAVLRCDTKIKVFKQIS
jgi:hypothetical protein